MRRLVMCLLALLCMLCFAGYDKTGTKEDITYDQSMDQMGKDAFTIGRTNLLIKKLKLLLADKENNIIALAGSNQEIYETVTPMEALDAAKERYAANFDKVYKEQSQDYFYKLSFADYYLVYEGLAEDGKYYLIHLYEFVTDDPDTNIGHTVTYGWYLVDKVTGEILDSTQ